MCSPHPAVVWYGRTEHHAPSDVRTHPLKLRDARARESSSRLTIDERPARIDSQAPGVCVDDDERRDGARGRRERRRGGEHEGEDELHGDLRLRRWGRALTLGARCASDTGVDTTHTNNRREHKHDFKRGHERTRRGLGLAAVKIVDVKSLQGFSFRLLRTQYFKVPRPSLEL